MIQKENIITADEGKVFRRLSDGQIYGNQIYLGWEFPSDGEPYEAKPEHYEEVDEPITEDTPLITDDYPLLPTEKEMVTLDEPVPEEQIPDEPVPLRKVTYSDYMELRKEVEQLKKRIYGDTDQYII